MVLLTITFHFSTQAQGYHLGLRLGYLNSELLSDDVGTPGLINRQNFSIGLVHTHKPYLGKWGFSVETAYQLKGPRVADEDINYRMHYLSAPVMVDFYPTSKLRLSVGPELNYLLDGRNEINSDSSITLKNVIDSRLLVSGAASVSYALDYYIDIGVRYSRDFTVLSDLDAILNRRKTRHQTFQVFLYFKIAN